MTIIGGGLTGLFAALRLGEAGASVTLIDSAFASSEGSVGGFAAFSGAKFSLPPAGMGLLPVAGTQERFERTIHQVLETLGISRDQAASSVERDSTSAFSMRQYESIVLSPEQISELLEGLSQRVQTTALVLRGRASNLFRGTMGWATEVALPENVATVQSHAIFYAAGRLSQDLIAKAGAQPTPGKGLDVGVRLEFLDKQGLSKLRSLGADAKILDGSCRTFCLNSPGRIYRYPYQSFSIPGGVVASADEPAANVGLLLRTTHKANLLERIHRVASADPLRLIRDSDATHRSSKLSLPAQMNELYGEEVVRDIEEFGTRLHREGLIDLRLDHRIHIPLLDWHWKTFALPGSHRTTLENVFALGDSSGHARGLLQACISGRLAAEEYLS